MKFFSCYNLFRSYASKAVPVRETDSLVKQKLRASSERLTVDLRDFNPNSDIVSNAVNVYMVPCVIEYSRTQLPKKILPDHARIQVRIAWVSFFSTVVSFFIFRLNSVVPDHQFVVQILLRFIHLLFILWKVQLRRNFLLIKILNL